MSRSTNGCGSRWRGRLLRAAPDLPPWIDHAELAHAQEQGYLVLRKPVSPVELHAVLAQWLGPQKNQSKQPSALYQ